VCSIRLWGETLDGSGRIVSLGSSLLCGWEAGRVGGNVRSARPAAESESGKELISSIALPICRQKGRGC